MKQYITIKQFDELNNEQGSKLKNILRIVVEDEFIKIEDYNFLVSRACTIGKMIEILENENEFQISKWNDWMVYTNKTGEIRRNELCDALWKTVKQIL